MTTIGNALSGLKAAQSSINVISDNIANASTEGYTRKVLPQETRVTQLGEGFGIKLNEIIRKVDMTLVRDMFNQNSITNYFSVREDFLGRLQAFHGASDAENAISSELNRLQDTFTQLTTAPEDLGLLRTAVAGARATANKFNDLSNTLTTLRNDAQAELKVTVDKINAILEDVRDLNIQINGQYSTGRSTANLQDKRDMVLKELSEYMDIKFYGIENDQVVVMTDTGVTLVDKEERKLIFNPIPLGVESSYGAGNLATLELEGKGGVVSNNIDLTGEELGGKVQALMELRDETFPKYQAQLDELAQKTALRFSEQGLDLFVNKSGDVPQNVAPPAPVDYVGFSRDMRVNQAVIDDPTLIRTGTNGETVLPGANTVIDRILEFTFGDFQYFESQGNVDISAGTIFAATGLTQTGRVIGDIDLTDLAALEDDLNITAGSQFSVDTGGGPVAITINAGDTAMDLVNNINATVGPGTSRLNGLGQIVFEANSDITLADISLGNAGIQALGHDFGTFAATNPKFTVEVGKQSPVTIEIDPTDTQTELLANLNAIDGLTATIDGSGFLVLETLDANGVNHGELNLVDGQGSPVAALGLNTRGVKHAAYRTQNLGPDGDIDTELTGSLSLDKYARSMVSYHAEEHALAEDRTIREETYFNTLNERLLGDTGVDIDEELSNLIRFQTAYTAVTRLIQSAEEQFDDLINSF